MENEIQPIEPKSAPEVVPQDVDTNTNGLLPDGSTDKEGAMAKADLFKLGQYSYKLFKKIQDEDQLEAWVQAKITKAADYIASVYHYLEYEMKFSEYGHQLDNSDVLSESQKAAMKLKLSEAKETLRALKIAQAQKLAEGKSPKAKKDWDQDGEIESEKDEVIGSRRKAAGLDKKEECMKEAAPSADLSKKEKSAVVKKAKAGKDIGKPGKGFEKVADKAAKKYGSKEKGEKVAAAAMWKNIKEGVASDIDTINKPEKFAPVKPENIKADPMAAQGYPDPDQGSAPVKSIEQSIADLKTSNPGIYKFLSTHPSIMDAIKQDPKILVDLITSGSFQEGQINELNLKPFTKKSAFSKKGYDSVAKRQSDKMKDAEAATDAADESDDIEGLSKASADWKKAKLVKAKAEQKASKAKNESSNETDFSAKNVGKAVGNVVQGVKNTANAVSSAYDSAKTAVADFEKGYDSAKQKPATTKASMVKESIDLDTIRALSGLK